MSIILNKELFQKLNDLIAASLPSKIIKRGNAFALIELNEENKIQTAYSTYSFSGLNIYKNDIKNEMLILEGEAFYKKGSIEIEFECFVEINPQASLNSLKITSFILDIQSNTIDISVSQ